MKVIVIPDCHLKPYMFTEVDELLKNGIAERAVCLGDIPDDWNRGYDLELYKATFDAAISFAKEHPDTFWCYGNHDLSYLLNYPESGFSTVAAPLVRSKIYELEHALNPDNPIKFVQRVDNVLFCHGGVSQFFVDEYVPLGKQEDIGRALDVLNNLYREHWNDASPVWLRPQYNRVRMYRPDMLQVVGHTPVEKLEKINNVLSTDLFSTYPQGGYIGTCEYAVIDTVTGDYFGVKSKGI